MTTNRISLGCLAAMLFVAAQARADEGRLAVSIAPAIELGHGAFAVETGRWVTFKTELPPAPGQLFLLLAPSKGLGQFDASGIVIHWLGKHEGGDVASYTYFVPEVLANTTVALMLAYLTEDGDVRSSGVCTIRFLAAQPASDPDPAVLVDVDADRRR